MNVFQIQPGWTAYDVMAEKLGVAIEVGSTYVLVEKGPILPGRPLRPPVSRQFGQWGGDKLHRGSDEGRDRDDGLAEPARRRQLGGLRRNRCPADKAKAIGHNSAASDHGTAARDGAIGQVVEAPRTTTAGGTMVSPGGPKVITPKSGGLLGPVWT